MLEPKGSAGKKEPEAKGESSLSLPQTAQMWIEEGELEEELGEEEDGEEDREEEREEEDVKEENDDERENVGGKAWRRVWGSTLTTRLGLTFGWRAKGATALAGTRRVSLVSHWEPQTLDFAD